MIRPTSQTLHVQPDFVFYPLLDIYDVSVAVILTSPFFTDTHPQLSTLMQQAADCRASAFRPGTVANHERYMRSYVAFCLTYQIDDLDPTPAQLSAYVEFLLQSGIAATTEPNFLSGTRHYLQAAGMSDSVLSSYTLGLTLRSLKIAYETPPNRKRPLTLDQVRRLMDYCQLRGLLGFTLKLAIVLGFFALLRISNLAPPTVATFDPYRHSTRADLTLEAPGLQFAQRWAKNRQVLLPDHEVPRIPIPRLQDDPLDPVSIMVELFNLTSTAAPHEPLLLVPMVNGRHYVLDQCQLRSEFRQALVACDLDPRHYAIHSLRRGGATLLHAAGASVDDIKQQGLWRSEAVRQYIQDCTLTQSSVLDAFASAINEGASTSGQRTPTPDTPPGRPWQSTPAHHHRGKSPRPFKKGPHAKNKHFRKQPPRGN